MLKVLRARGEGAKAHADFGHDYELDEYCKLLESYSMIDDLKPIHIQRLSEPYMDKIFAFPKVSFQIEHGQTIRLDFTFTYLVLLLSTWTVLQKESS